MNVDQKIINDIYDHFKDIVSCVKIDIDNENRYLYIDMYVYDIVSINLIKLNDIVSKYFKLKNSFIYYYGLTDYTTEDIRFGFEFEYQYKNDD